MVNYHDIERVNGEIKPIEIRGTDADGNVVKESYAKVAQRITAFRKLFPEGQIHTSVVSHMNGTVMVKASIYADYHNCLATAHAQESAADEGVNATSYVENCETSAVGRALGFCGIGVEDNVATAEELAAAITQQRKKKEKKAEEENNEEAQLIGKKRAVALRKELKKRGLPEEQILTLNNVNRLEDLTVEQMRKIVSPANGKK